jgi:transcriptional regulator
MYLPKFFQENRRPVLRELIEKYPLATLVYKADEELTVNHVPLLYFRNKDKSEVLRGHVARANPLWKDIGRGISATAIFNGPDAYISPSFYPSKKNTGEVVPTWNFAVVHAHGNLCSIDDAEWLGSFVTDLTDRKEASLKHPWAVSDAPDGYIEKMVNAIVGIELRIKKLEGKFKLSQNRSQEDHEGVRTGLRASGICRGIEVAALMEE